MTEHLSDLFECDYWSIQKLEAYLKDTKRPTLYFDAETCPADDETVKSFFREDKIKLPKHPGQFNPELVKYGNAVKPEAREKKLKSAEASHFTKLVEWEQKCKEKQEEAWETHLDEVLLNPLCGRIHSIGYGVRDQGGIQVCLDSRHHVEATLIGCFTHLIGLVLERGGKIVGFRSHFFDLPMIRARGLCCGVKFPKELWLPVYNKWNSQFSVDIRDLWAGGNFKQKGTLDEVARAMGVRTKLEGMSGKDYWKVYNEDQPRALRYLRQDIVSTADIAEQMDII